jgi:carbonic anhydrase
MHTAGLGRTTQRCTIRGFSAKLRPCSSPAASCSAAGESKEPTWPHATRYPSPARSASIGAAALPLVAVTVAKTAVADECAVFTNDRQKSVTLGDAIRMLKEGNERFVAGKSVNCNLLAQVRATAGGQAPFAAIVGCIDSRVPPELVFDQHIGDIFAARIAGNFVDSDIIGSLEFATKIGGAKAIVVLGHTECGAIKGAIDQVKLGNLTKMLENFNPAIEASKSVAGERSSTNKKLVQAVADTNAKLAAKMLVDKSDVLRELVEKEQLVIAAAMHDVGTGKVAFFG